MGVSRTRKCVRPSHVPGWADAPSAPSQGHRCRRKYHAAGARHAPMHQHHQDALQTYEWHEAAMRVLTSGGTARVGLERRSADLSLRGDCRPVQVPIPASPLSRPLPRHRRPDWRWPAAAYGDHRAPRDLTTGRFAVLDTVLCPDEHAAGGFRPCPGQGTGAHPSSAISGNPASASTRGVIEVPARLLRVVPDVRDKPDVRPALAACGQGDEHHR